VPSWDNVEEYRRARQATDDNRRMRTARWITKATNTSWCRQVNWRNCGIPDWTAQFPVWKMTEKYSSEARAICPPKLRSLLSFSVMYDVTNKIAHFNWECVGRFRPCSHWDRQNEYTYKLKEIKREVVSFTWYALTKHLLRMQGENSTEIRKVQKTC